MRDIGGTVDGLSLVVCDMSSFSILSLWLEPNSEKQGSCVRAADRIKDCKGMLMITIEPRFSTGIKALDEILQMILPGDNLVWQIAEIDDYRPFAQAYARQAVKRGKNLVYFRFAGHSALLPDDPAYTVKEIDPAMGFESFTIEIRKTIQRELDGAWYLFDCLSDLPVHWYSDLMLGNFFILICPYILRIQALGYFALMRNRHSIAVTARIRKTTQIFIDTFRYRNDLYIQPMKVDQRRSPTMYLPHHVENERFQPVTDSATIAKVASDLTTSGLANSNRTLDIWERSFLSAQRLHDETAGGFLPGEVAAVMFRKLLNMVLSQDKTILEMAERYLTLADVLVVKKRLIGTGRIGGKAVGMLLARAILTRANNRWDRTLEIHDSYFIGSDVYYTFIVQNNCWEDRQNQRDETSFLTGIEEARHKILAGSFPEFIIEQFIEMLDYFGQSPIIVRSSSLLEDNFGNAFSGKYESVFCINQGSREDRLDYFIDAVRRVYASTMSHEALVYRSQRHLLEGDEQMAILVQRVSGSVHGTMFMPHVAGVGYSFNPYAWSSKIDPNSGVLRLVCGLGTRAVDRHDDDYTRIVALNAPNLLPEKSLNAGSQYAQSHVDVLDLQENALKSVNFDYLALNAHGFPLERVATKYGDGYAPVPDVNPWVLTFDELLADSPFINDMRDMLRILQSAYSCPVDVEFTANFGTGSRHQINLLQCRPLQTAIRGEAVKPPKNIKTASKLFDIHGAIIGPNQLIQVDRIMYVVPESYGKLREQERHEAAKLVGRLMHMPSNREKTIMLMGPGRWGTSMPALGIPVHFADINTVTILCEMVEMNDTMIPDVSLGTHFFNDIVEAGIIYLAIFPQVTENYLNREFFLTEPNRLTEIAPAEARFADLVRVIDADNRNSKQHIILYANTIEQQAVCYFSDSVSKSQKHSNHSEIRE
jgi:pyruvate, water dikinase